MKNRYTLVFGISFLLTIFPTQQSLEKILENNESQIDQRYYDLLAHSEDEIADINFIRSRDPENMSLEESFIEMIAQASNAQTIVETGTYLGDSTEKMARHFKQVITIELGKELYEKAKKRFVKKKNVILHEGDSAQVLPTILPQLKGKVVFFLDAHFSMHDTACGSENTPIITELEIIRKAGLKDSIIIIDDVRMFYKPIANVSKTFMEGYPTVNDLVDKLLEINPAYQIATVYDTLIAFPAADLITISPVVKATTMSRLYHDDNYSIDDIIAAELCIAHATGKEQEILLDLGQRWVEPWSQAAGLSGHYALWAGLIYMEQQEYNKAFAYFAEAKKRGLHHWRIDWYMIMAQANCFFDIK
ncbi:hypothetical protein BH09DEP1_BH09DEP1_1160 [soil metagenome]